MTEAPAADKAINRIFLVVVDESPELKVALRYACIRARKTGGRVALLAVVEPAEAQQWMGVNELMREEARMAAEQILQKVAADVQKTSNAMPILCIREGNRRDELLKLMSSKWGTPKARAATLVFPTDKVTIEVTDGAKRLDIGIALP